MRLSIQSNDWMSLQTKESALLKLSTMNAKIGYPDRYEDRKYMEDGISKRMERYANGEKTLTSSGKQWIFILTNQHWWICFQ